MKRAFCFQNWYNLSHLSLVAVKTVKHLLEWDLRTWQTSYHSACRACQVRAMAGLLEHALWHQHPAEGLASSRTAASGRRLHSSQPWRGWIPLVEACLPAVSVTAFPKQVAFFSFLNRVYASSSLSVIVFKASIFCSFISRNTVGGFAVESRLWIQKLHYKSLLLNSE